VSDNSLLYTAKHIYALVNPHTGNLHKNTNPWATARTEHTTTHADKTPERTLSRHIYYSDTCDPPTERPPTPNTAKHL